MSSPRPPPLEQLIRRIGALPAREMARAEVRRWFRFSEPDDVVAQLDELVVRSMRRDDAALAVELAVVDFILHADETDSLTLEALDLAVGEAPETGATWLLADHPPRRVLDGVALRNRQQRRHVPLGVRRWHARSSNRQALEALLEDPDPRVIENLCINPRVREGDIVAIASRRPNRADVLDAIARSRWLSSDQVRKTLIQNPYTQTRLAIGLLPQIDLRLLASLRYTTDLHEAVGQAATFLMGLVG